MPYKIQGLEEGGMNWEREILNDDASLTEYTLKTGFLGVDSNIVCSGTGTFNVYVPSGYEKSNQRFMVADTGGNNSVTIVISFVNPNDKVDNGSSYNVVTGLLNQFFYVGPNSNGGSNWISQY